MGTRIKNECCGSDVAVVAIPMNTTGMGNMSDTSGDMLTFTPSANIANKKNSKKLKRLKKYTNRVKPLKKYLDENK